jgi:hypothetical protein
MPFQAAKALAANFTWSIRFALTPLFGPEFPSECLQPSDGNFGDFKIDKSITGACSEEQQSWLDRSDARHTPTPGTPAGSPSDADLSASASEAGSPLMPKLRSPFQPWRFKQLKPKASTVTRPKALGTPESAVESGYGTEDTDYSSELALFSPEVSPKTVPLTSDWTAINRTPKERDAVEGLITLATSVTPTPANSPARSYISLARPSPMQGVDACGVEERLLKEKKKQKKRSRREIDNDVGEDEEYAGDESTEADDDGAGRKRNKPEVNKLKTTESSAAYWLMQLSMVDNANDEGRPVKRTRRAST